MKQPNASHEVTQMQEKKEKQKEKGEKVGIKGHEVKQHIASATEKGKVEQALQQPREITDADSDRNAEPPTNNAHGQPQPEQQEQQEPLSAAAATPSAASESKIESQESISKFTPSSKKGRHELKNQAGEEKVRESEQPDDALKLYKVTEDSKETQVIEFHPTEQQPEYGSQPEYPSPVTPRSNHYPNQNNKNNNEKEE